MFSPEFQSAVRQRNMLMIFQLIFKQNWLQYWVAYFWLLIIKLLNKLAPMDAVDNSSGENASVPKQIIWRRNCPYLYSLLYVSQLDWPSLTVDWISAYQSSMFTEDVDNAYNLILGTQTDNSQQNRLIYARVRIPNQKMLRKKYEKQRLAKTQTVKKNDEMMPVKIQILGQIPHDGQVNRVRHNPHQFTKIASKTTCGQIHIFSTSSTKKEKSASPQIRLSGHDTEGYALQWNPNRNWFIISGSYDGKLSLWDINKKQQGNVVNPLINFNFHRREIEDVSYNKFHESIFMSCDDEGITALWDSRNCNRSPIFNNRAHEGAQYGCQFSPSSQYNYITGGADFMLKVWDLRNSSVPIYTCSDMNAEEITQVQWSREDPTTAWSVAGGKATLWDLTTQKPKFVHACRSSQDLQNPTKIYQMSVNINQPDTIATVDSNNQVQVFQPNENCKA